MDNFWLMFGAVLVFWMQAGFALLEVGTVAKKNTKNILVKNVFDAAIGALCWWGLGYAIAYGPGDNYPRTGKNGFAATQGFFFDYNAKAIKKESHFESKASWFFQWAFAGAATTIVSGCVAERASFFAYVSYAIVLTSVVYPCVAHMTWSSDGFLSPWRPSSAEDGSGGRLIGGCGFIDFAGSGTVHMTGGVAALVGAILIGPRKDRFSPGYVLPDPNPVYQCIGVLILWMGWYGFNGASTLAIVGYSGIAAHVMMTTTIAASTACLFTTLIGYFATKDRVIDPCLVNNGVLAGLVAVTSSCATCSLWGAMIIGLVASPIYYFASLLLKKLHIDDVVDAIPVHLCCGAFGAIAPALFSTPYYYGASYFSDRKFRCAGIFYGGTGGSLKAAVIAVLVITAWVGSTMIVVFGIARALKMHRVSVEVEIEGLDASKHGGSIVDGLTSYTGQDAGSPKFDQSANPAPTDNKVSPAVEP